jgi:hypothetical protein
MPIRIKIRNAETGSIIDMEIEPENRIEELIESAASYWEKEPNAYILRKGRSLLRGQTKVIDAGLRASDTLELLPDPEGGA